nr:MAG TPA: hypothetical protein [Caudoviricetes sp.]
MNLVCWSWLLLWVRVSPGSYVIGRRGYGISCVGFVVLGSTRNNAVIIL